MKYFVVSLIILGVLSTSAFAELNDNDLNKIRLIVKEEVKTEIKASETRMKEYVDIKIDGFETRVNDQFDSMNKRITDTKNLTYVLIAFIGAVIVIPLWRDRKDRKLEKQVETLIQEIETLKKQRITAP